MDYQIQLEVFEGPFDLLLDLIEKNEINIYDIPIAIIVQQYLNYIKRLQEHDLVVSGDFLVMAATLLGIKSKMLLPQDSVKAADDESEEDPRDELVERLVEYKFYKQIANLLEHKVIDVKGVVPRVPDNNTGKAPIFTNPIGNVSVNDLQKLYKKVLQAHKESRQVKQIPKFASLNERINRLRLQLSRCESIIFTELLETTSPSDIVLTFLGVLELIRLQEITVFQEKEFGEIVVKVLS